MADLDKSIVPGDFIDTYTVLASEPGPCFMCKVPTWCIDINFYAYFCDSEGCNHHIDHDLMESASPGSAERTCRRCAAGEVLPARSPSTAINWLNCFACSGWAVPAEGDHAALVKRARAHIEKRHPELDGPFQRAFNDDDLLDFMLGSHARFPSAGRSFLE